MAAQYQISDNLFDFRKMRETHPLHGNLCDSDIIPVSHMSGIGEDALPRYETVFVTLGELWRYIDGKIQWKNKWSPTTLSE